MSLSAAELQERHRLEGAPDPFPSLGGGPAATPAAPSSAKPKSNGSSSIDTSSESAFPSLGASSTSAPAVTKPASSMWSAKATAASKIAKSPATGLVTKAGGLGRAGATGPSASSHPFTDSFSVPANDVATGKQLSETIAKVQKETGVLVESSNQSGRKTFHLRGQDQKRLDKAKALIHRGISKTVTLQVEVPISTFGTIIGPKGATLKSITEVTGCKIDIPRRETLPAAESAAASTADDEADSEDEAEDPTASITITGPSVSASDARARIEALISHKTSQTSTSIKHIPSHFYPFIAGPKGVKARLLEEELGEGDINIAIPPPAVWKALERQANGEQAEEVTETGKNKKDLAIRVRGDKVKVQRVVDEINKQYENLLDSLSELSIGLPKRQHRFLVGQAADEVLEQTGCIIELPRVDDPSDQICIRGPQLALGTALQLSMEKANKIKVETVDVAQQHRNAPNPSGHAKQILHYLIRTQRLRNIAESHNDVKVFPPFAAVVDATGQVVIEVVGEDKAQVQKAKEAVIAAIKEITPAAVQTLEIDFALHKFLIGKKGSKIAQFESANKVTTVFPPAADESSVVTLIYTGPLDAFGPAGKERDGKVKEVLKAAKVELENLAKEAADVKSQTLDIDQKWHKAIIGPGGAILNAIIGDDQIVNVRIGAGPRSQTNGKTSEDANVVVVRGPSTEVDRVVKEIKQVVEDAENDNIVNGYTVEFNVDKKHVPHLVGSSGAAINKLREEFGVKINFDDDDKKSTKPVAQCKIVGRKELVEKAKERVLEQIERLADETTETVNIKRALQPALIGSGGKYAIRLEEKYGVKLSFPRENKDGTAPSKPDEVVIRGGKKGVAQAKAELLEAAAFESETRQSATFTVPTKSVSMIVGKAGATINAIKDDTGAKIDIDKSAGSDDKTTVTVSGDKKAIAAAKAAVLAVVEQVGDELTTTLTIEPKFHRSLIGQGGQKLRDLVAACGGPEEAFKQNGLINFPRQGDSNTDQVRLRGDKTLVTKIKAELEKQVKLLRETKVLGVVVPASTHASRIGRGGAALQDLQKKTGAVVHFPGSRSYNSVGDIANADDLKDADPKEIVKVIGSEEATTKAIEQLSTVIEQPARNGPKGGRTGGNDYPTRTISIPAKYHHALVEGGNLTRSIRNVGGFLVQPQASQPKPAVSRPTVAEGAKEARIDADDNGGDDVEYGWELKANYEGLGDDEEEWVVRAKEENLDKAVAVLNQAVEKAKQATHVGALVGLPRSAFPRIIGSKGATISRLRAETGADIHVGQDDDLITITGDETSVEQAKEAIVSIVTRSGGQRY